MGVGPDNEVFNENDFEECFKKVDVDGSGTIDKDEMFKFIKIASGAEWLVFVIKDQKRNSIR